MKKQNKKQSSRVKIFNPNPHGLKAMTKITASG
jgi:hypothetical protein